MTKELRNRDFSLIERKRKREREREKKVIHSNCLREKKKRLVVRQSIKKTFAFSIKSNLDRSDSIEM